MMAKSTKKKVEKELAKAKEKSSELLKDINDIIASAKHDLQKQMDELTEQVKLLSKDPAKEAMKLLKKAEKQYKKQLANIHKEFDERTEALVKAKDKLIAPLEDEIATRFGKAPKAKSDQKPAEKPKAEAKAPSQSKAKKDTKADAATSKAATAKKAAAKTTKAKPATANKVVAKTATKTKAKPEAQQKAAAAKPAKVAKPKVASKATKSPLASVKGIGPVTIQKLEDAGIKTLEDLATPSAAKKKTLEGFSSVRGFDTWQEQAKALLK